MPIKLSEAQIERQCSDFLALDGWRGLKTDPCSDRRRGKGFGELGMADHLYIRYLPPGVLRYYLPPDRYGPGLAQVLWVEYKGPRGKLSPHQITWATNERDRGAMVAQATVDFAPSFDGFTDWYRGSGLLRREGL